MSQTNPDTTPLYEMNPLSRFSDRAADYVKYRPSYPAAAIDAILEGLGNPEQLVAVDVGAGTGISSRLLGDRKVRVLAIEPNAEMRQAAEPHPLVEFREATAEATQLPDASVDLVVCFQAFHWFNPEPTLLEFHRILKPSGRVALVWNNRDRNDPFTRGYVQLTRLASNNLSDKRVDAVEPFLKTSHFVNIRQRSFVYRQEMDLAGLIGRAHSTSYLPREGPEHEQLISDLQDLYTTWASDRGYVCLVHNTNVHLAEKNNQ